jgi:hypothetical protein
VDGPDILRAIVAERLELLDKEPREEQVQSSGYIFSFCNGAAEALAKAGLLSIPAKAAIIDHLIRGLEARKLGQRVSASAEATTEIIVMPQDADSHE